MEGCSFLHFSHFSFVFPSGLDFGPSRAPFWSGFGLLFLTFFASKADQKINGFSHHFFLQIFDFGPKMAPKIYKNIEALSAPFWVPKWSPNGTQNGSRIGGKIEKKTYAIPWNARRRISYKNQWFFNIFSTKLGQNDSQNDFKKHHRLK